MHSAKSPSTSWEFYLALYEQFKEGGSQAAVAKLLIRLIMEVEALREALSNPETPESVRQSYRAAWQRIAVLSHNAAGPSGGTEKILHCFFPDQPSTDRFAPEMMMMERLGATAEEKQALRDKMEEVEMYT